MSHASLINKLFPLDYGLNSLSKMCKLAEDTLANTFDKKCVGRVPGAHSSEIFKKIINEYSNIPTKKTDINKITSNFVTTFFSGAPVWRSPNLQYNVGAPVNVLSTAISAIAEDINIYNINTGLSGNALAAEKAVSNILCSFAKIDKCMGSGIFTFGGTATNLYAMKIAINKSCPNASKNGLPSNVKFLVTEDAHFSHAVAANWLGLGTNNLIIIPAKTDRTSDICKAEKLMNAILANGNILAGIIVNGGTTYDHAIDDIHSFRQIRDKLEKKYCLEYRPHIHVDSVIGWSWLVFSNYNFKQNRLKLQPDLLNSINRQYQLISKINQADSWGVDFHKGIGGCPIPCSVFMSNKKSDFLYLSKKEEKITQTHQVATEMSFDSPSDYTLETSRSGAAPLAALIALHSLGKDGYRRCLANLVNMTALFRRKILKTKGVVVLNPSSKGFVTMLILIPKELENVINQHNAIEQVRNGTPEIINLLNSYTKSFFCWDNQTRIEKENTIVYSFSSSYIRSSSGIPVGALKFYPTSPHFDEEYALKTAETIAKQKLQFDMDYYSKE